MIHALFIDNDNGSLVLFREICTHLNLHYTGIQNPVHIEQTLPRLTQMDVIFVDLEMPMMNGYQVLEILKRYPAFHGIPIVACTVHAGELENARKAGFSSFIVKPINIEAFPRQMQDILNGQKIWESYG